jgi:four helix bundle protein
MGEEDFSLAKINRFEDLQCWQKARLLANVIYNLTEGSKFVKDKRLRGQIRGKAGSVMHSIAEGFEAGSNLEFVRFLKMARRSATAVQSELYLALDRKYITPAKLTSAYDLGTETKRLINSLISHLRKSHPSNLPTAQP